MVKLFGNVVTFLLGAAVMAAAAFVLPERKAEVAQPIAFNHKKHVEAGWECVNCHPYVEEQPFAGLPTAQDCVDCHRSEMPKYPDNKKMREITEQLEQLIAEGRDIPWVKVHRVADHVYFSHRRHVAIGKLDCKECHGDVANMTEPFTRHAFPLPSFPKEFAYDESVRKMEWCRSCHMEKGVTVDCAACHR